MPRIPKLTVTIEGAPRAEVSVTIGDRTVSSSLLGVDMPNNPGDFEVMARWGEQEQRASVSLKEGGAEHITLTFHAAPGAPTPDSPESSETPASSRDTHRDQGSGAGAQSDGGTTRTLGWISLGVGGAGLAFGGITYFMAAAAKSDAEEACGGSLDNCSFATDVPQSTIDDANGKVDDYNSINKFPAIGFIVGGVGVVTGIVLLLVSGGSDEGHTAGVTPWLGLGAAGVSGRF